jgi:prepilin-type N-terminal cleavage/methylation domain-containing protein
MKILMFRVGRNHSGFTIVELLIVIVIVAILAAITVVAYNGVQSRARDSKRAQDLAIIKKALLLYQATNGGVPNTYSAGSYTGGTIYSGWDSSISPNWLAFLRPSHGNMPTDPKNTTVDNNPPAGGNFVYYYYCYNAGSGPLPATDNVVVGYHKDNNTAVSESFPVNDCL